MFVKMRGKQEHYTLTYDQDRLTFILCNDAAAGSAAIAMTCMENTLESIVLPEFALLTRYMHATNDFTIRKHPGVQHI